jgi:1,4-alpha-glucan branching enzyme
LPALHELDCDPAGFQWLDANDSEQSVTAYLRQGRSPEDVVLCAFNHTPVPRQNYRIGAPRPGFWREVLNSDAVEYAGSGQGNLGGVEAGPLPSHGQPHSVTVTLPPLGAVFLRAPRPGESGP